MPRTTEESGKSPAFQFYPKDFLTDSKVIVMPPEVRGMYITLLCLDWLEDGFLKSDMLKLAGYEWHDRDGNLKSTEEHGTAIAQLSQCFISHPKKEGFCTNPRIQKERRAQEERRNERSVSGKKGAKAKWNNNLEGMAQPSLCHASAIPKTMANDASSSSSSSSSTDNQRLSVSLSSESESEDPPIPSKSRSRKPKPPDPELVQYGLHIRMTAADMLDLETAFGSQLVRQNLPIADRWIKESPNPNASRYRRANQNHYLYFKNWLTKEITSTAPTKANTTFKPHCCSTTLEHNMEFLKTHDEGSDEQRHVEEMLGVMFGNQEVIEVGSVSVGSVVPITNGFNRPRGH